MEIDTLCCGMLVADFSFALPRRPDYDEKIKADSFFLTTGGPAANAALTIRLLNGLSELVATTSSDPLGKSLIQTLQHDGFNTDFIIEGSGGLNTSAILTIADGSRNVISHKAQLQPTELPEKIKNLSPKVLLFDGHLPELSLKLMKLFPQAITVLDAGSVHPGTLKLYKKVHWLIGSKKFATSFTNTNETSLREAVLELKKEVANVIITDGSSGLLYVENKKLQHLPSYKIKVVDSNGAGDVFHGAFCYGLANKFSLKDNLKFASATAALSCTGRGIRTNIKPLNDILSFANIKMDKI